MIVAPSLLSIDFLNVKEQLSIINKKCKWIHFDVMDGHFVDNIALGTGFLKTIRKNSSLFLDVHIMTDIPEKVADMYIKAGADNITFHYEATNSEEDCHRIISYLKEKYVKVGLSIKPGTNPEKLIPFLDEVDMVLIMSVEPGFGGQAFIEETYNKIAFFREYRRDCNLNYLIEVDGGVNDQNAHNLKNAGCDVIVAGSYVFKGDIEQNIENITFYD